MVRTRHRNVIFVPPVVTPMLSPPGHQQPLLPTPVKVRNLQVALAGYSPTITEFLVSGFTNGFPLHFDGDIYSFEAPNLVSARQFPAVVDLKLHKEIAAGRIAAGPFVDPPISSFSRIPIGCSAQEDTW